MASVEKALGLLKSLPQVTLGNLRPLPGRAPLKRRLRRGQHGGKYCGRGKRGQGKFGTLPRIGFEGGNTPFYLMIPKEPYYKGHHIRKQYPPLSLLQLQRLVDLGRVNPDEPIDLTALCNSKVISVHPHYNQYGINLTDEGADIFQAKLNLEVQWTNEIAISAIERCGGTITTRFYDLRSIKAMSDPHKFFLRGLPIPRCKLPSQDVIDYYSDPKNRGYLADPDAIRQARIELAQKFGYDLPDISRDEKFSMLLRRKDPRQIWYGLAPGWVVNLQDRTVLKPKDADLKDYYKS